MTRCRTPAAVSNRKPSPLQNTIASATGHGIFMAPQIVNAKNAFNPIPGASAIGQLVRSAKTVVMIAEASAVAVTTAPKSSSRG